MSREHFTQKILDVKHKVLKMGALVENSIESVMTALEAQDIDIARVILEIDKEPLIKPLVDIPRMAFIAQEMIKMSLDAFVKEDTVLAEKAAGRDEEVDSLYETIISDILQIITERKEHTKQGTKLMFIGRYLERIADHSTNICERTIYMITGDLKEIN